MIDGSSSAPEVIGGVPTVARLQDVGLRYGKTVALEEIKLDVPSGCMVGLIGPDGLGKSSLLALIAGARSIQAGRVEVLGGDMADAAHRQVVGRASLTCPRAWARTSLRPSRCSRTSTSSAACSGTAAPSARGASLT